MQIGGRRDFWEVSVGTLGVVALIESFGRCGFTRGGSFYGEDLHRNEDFFAVDITRGLTGVPFANGSANIPVLAVAEGGVARMYDWVQNDIHSAGNSVMISHMTRDYLAEWLQLWRLGNPEDDIANLRRGDRGWVNGVSRVDFTAGKLAPRYTSSYVHLAGPFLIFVSRGMYVAQGTVLGYMDNTGISSGSHLHFVMYDRTLRTSRQAIGRSTRPVPFDGLDFGDVPSTTGHCVTSTNRPII